LHENQYFFEVKVYSVACSRKKYTQFSSELRTSPLT